MKINKIYCSFNNECKERDFISIEDTINILNIDRLSLMKLISSDSLRTIFSDKSKQIELSSIKKYINKKGNKLMTNNNFMTLSAASDLLNISEKSINNLIEGGKFESSTGAYGKTTISRVSLQRYALKNDIKLDDSFSENFTINETMKLLRVEENKVHQFLQNGKLSHKLDGGKMKVCGKSVAECLKKKVNIYG